MIDSEARKSSTAFDVDVVFKEIGEFGRYQVVNYVWICTGIIVYSAITLAYIFTAGTVNYR